MNNQKKGALMQMLVQFSALAYGVAPGVAAAWKIPFLTFGLGRDPQRSQDNSIDASPLPAKYGCGDAVVPPDSVVTVFDLRWIGVWLKFLLGAPTVRKAITKQPTNVTGVTIFHANPLCPSGAGTLTFTAIGTTLTWTPQGGAAGAAVNIAAGGRFTLQGGAANEDIQIHVEAAFIPVGNQADADIMAHATLKTHDFPIDLADRPHGLVELGHKDVAATEFYRYLGFMVSQIALPGTAKDQDVTMTAFAARELSADTDPAVVAVWDAAPTDYNPVRACASKARLSNGVNGAFGVVTEFNTSINNQAVGESVADGQEGYGNTDNSEILITGDITTLFTGLTANSMWAKSRNHTSTRLRLESGASVGADYFSLVHDMPYVELMERKASKAGKTGLKVTAGYQAHRDESGILPKILLTNDINLY